MTNDKRVRYLQWRSVCRVYYLGHHACFLSGSAYQIEWVPPTLLAFVVTFLVGYKRRSVIGEKIEVVSD